MIRGIDGGRMMGACIVIAAAMTDCYIEDTLFRRKVLVKSSSHHYCIEGVLWTWDTTYHWVSWLIRTADEASQFNQKVPALGFNGIAKDGGDWEKISGICGRSCETHSEYQEPLSITCRVIEPPAQRVKRPIRQT